MDRGTTLVTKGKLSGSGVTAFTRGFILRAVTEIFSKLLGRVVSQLRYTSIVISQGVYSGRVLSQLKYFSKVIDETKYSSKILSKGNYFGKVT